MVKYGLLGYPLGHSFSKKYFLSKFEREGIDADFENFEFEHASDMESIILGMSRLKGFAVTIPHKQSVIALLDDTDDAVDHIGAVNCVKIDRGAGRISLKGYNTDIIGFEESFKEHLKASHKTALVLGTGGASKAVEYVLDKLDISYEMVSRQKSENNLCYEDISAQKLKNIQVVINTTPLGMFPEIATCPTLPYEAFTSDHYCYDLVYNPIETLFLAKAKAYGAKVKSGLDMLELQAEANWRIWNEA